MKYFTTLTPEQQALFAIAPQVYTPADRELFQYAIGANLYMTGRIDLYEAIVRKVQHTQTVTICFEDAIAESDVPACEMELIRTLTLLAQAVADKTLAAADLPAIFIRPRHPQHYAQLLTKLTLAQLAQVTGFVFAKVEPTNAQSYLAPLVNLSQQLGRIIYAMPILESRELIYQETRSEQLHALKRIFAQYRPYIINLRLGGTDFSAAYGLRRNVQLSLYDVRVVADCVSDMINFFSREHDGYVISGPVWEYFSLNPQSEEIQGLLRELQLDQVNGLLGKTAIHPSQVLPINIANTVSFEMYQDALRITNAQQTSGVFKGEGANKMNEIGPHRYWAQKIIARAHIYGVLQRDVSQFDLLRMGDK